MRCLALVVAPGLVLGGCGSSCDALPRLTAERDALRSSYLETVRSAASPEETARADERLHAVERQVFGLEKSCGKR